jgi:3',5'-cyclic AMP phosphodiesterase CpdA
LRWLQADLAANTNEWLIAFFHHPPYTKGSHDSETEISHIEMRENALPILESYGVDLVLGGHSHIYERSMLLHGHYGYISSLTSAMIKDAGIGRPSSGGAYFKGTSGPGANEGTVYVVAGNAGWATFRTGHHPVMIVDELEMGSVVLDVNGHRLDATFLRETGAIDDTFTIIKDSGVEPLSVSQMRREKNTAVLAWRSLAGEDYEIQQSATLEPDSWQPASGTIVANRTLSSWTNTIPVGPQQKFFRIRKL